MPRTHSCPTPARLPGSTLVISCRCLPGNTTSGRVTTHTVGGDPIERSQNLVGSLKVCRCPSQQWRLLMIRSSDVQQPCHWYEQNLDHVGASRLTSRECWTRWRILQQHLTKCGGMFNQKEATPSPMPWVGRLDKQLEQDLDPRLSQRRKDNQMGWGKWRHMLIQRKQGSCHFHNVEKFNAQQHGSRDCQRCQLIHTAEGPIVHQYTSPRRGNTSNGAQREVYCPKVTELAFWIRRAGSLFQEPEFNKGAGKASWPFTRSTSRGLSRTRNRSKPRKIVSAEHLFIYVFVSYPN